VPDWGEKWAAWAGRQSPSGPSKRRPGYLRTLDSALDAALSAPVQSLDTQTSYGDALLTLLAMADEACRGLSQPTESAFTIQAKNALAETGTLATISTSRGRVLPKTLTPQSGMTIRSLSRNVAFHRSEVDCTWKNPLRGLHPEMNLLLLPWPHTILDDDFRPAQVALEMAAEFGFFTFNPRERVDPSAVEACIRAAQRIDRVDIVVLPEASVLESELGQLQATLARNRVGFLVAGVREPGAKQGFGSNYAYFSALDDNLGEWRTYQQHKHHRWCIDGSQVRMYELARSLDPSKRWWEAIAIRPRKLTIFDMGRGRSLCPLVCEDLARIDPVAQVIRDVGPTLVLALLQDGPQLERRWPARYATILADDPGSSVLTLTSSGMATRSQPGGGYSPSRAVALWKDSKTGVRSIELARGSEAILLRLKEDRWMDWTADGRADPEATVRVVMDSDPHQIRPI
jgi:hypothetical protein